MLKEYFQIYHDSAMFSKADCEEPSMSVMEPEQHLLPAN